MMKLRSALLLLLCLMLGAVALGETVCMYVDLPGDFAPYGGGWGLAEDGSVWVGGGFGSPGQTRGGLLRAGLDLPEVSLVAILDAANEGFLRSETSLIQTIGRAARNAEGMVIMYADVVTDSMERAITETERRRAIQMAYNEEHGIVPKTIVKAIADSIEISDKAENAKRNTRRMGKMEREAAIERLTREMKEAAKLLEFEHAAFLRDQIDRLCRGENPTVDSAAETERKQNHAQTQRKGRKYLGKR